MKDKFDVIEEDGIVIYDDSDDYDSGEDGETPSDEPEEGCGFRLMTNEEIFTDEYMHEYARKMDDKIAKEKRQQRLISVGVIVTVVLFIGLVVYINFRNIM